jgi:hypothetical protein
VSRLGVRDCGRDEIGELARRAADRSGIGFGSVEISTVIGAPIAD